MDWFDAVRMGVILGALVLLSLLIINAPDETEPPPEVCTALDEPLARRCSPYYNTGKPGDSILWQQCMGVAPQ